jgi:hypothetical protein
LEINYQLLPSNTTATLCVDFGDGSVVKEQPLSISNSLGHISIASAPPFNQIYTTAGTYTATAWLKVPGNICTDQQYKLSWEIFITNTNCVPTNINQHTLLNELSIYPNPAKDKLTVTLINSDNSIITITDVLGKQLIREKLADSQTELNVSELNSGIYFVNVNGKTQKIVVEK